jgi:hypothetical protein
VKTNDEYVSELKQILKKYVSQIRSKPSFELLEANLANKVSYINKAYPESKVYYNGENIPIPYSETPYSKFDNYLVNQKYDKFDAGENCKTERPEKNEN